MRYLAGKNRAFTTIIRLIIKANRPRRYRHAGPDRKHQSFLLSLSIPRMPTGEKEGPPTDKNPSPPFYTYSCLFSCVALFLNFFFHIPVRIMAVRTSCYLSYDSSFFVHFLCFYMRLAGTVAGFTPYIFIFFVFLS